MLILILLILGLVLLGLAGAFAKGQPEPSVWWRSFLCWGLAAVVFAEVLRYGASLPMFQQLTR
jgi:hypothetical protein